MDGVIPQGAWGTLAWQDKTGADMRVKSWAAWAVVLAGCSGTPGGGSSSSSGAPAPLTTRTFLEQQSDALCSFDARCVNLRGQAYTTSDMCKAALRDRDALYEQAYGVGLVAYYEQNFTFSEEKARACLAWEQGRACNDTARGNPDCDAALTPKTPRAEGETCGGGFNTLGTAQLCNDTLAYCDSAPAPATADCLVCTGLKADAAACAVSSECLSNFCTGGTDGTDGVCAVPAPVQKSQPCQRSDECLGNLECNGTGATRTCNEKVALGGACDITQDNSGRNCQRDLECVGSGATGTCMARLADGEACARNPTTTPNCRHVCIFAAPDADMGTCSSPAMFPMGGEPCAGLDGDSRVCMLDGSVYPEFNVNLTGGVFTVTDCECRIPVGSGQTCTRNEGCADGLRCAGGGFNRQTGMFDTGACGPLLNNDQACRAGSDCSSGNCQRVGMTNMATCKPKASCP